MRNLLLILLLIPVVGWGQIVSLWKLNGNANDATGSYNGTAYSVTYTQGISGQAVLFTGAKNKYIVTGNYPDYSTITWGGWVRVDGNATDWFCFGKSYTNSDVGPIWAFQTYESDNYIWAYATNTTGTGHATDWIAPSIGKWYYVVGVLNGSLLKYYINGVYIAYSEFVGTIRTGAYPVYIGVWNQSRSSSNGGFNGAMDDMFVFNGVMSDAQIKNQYALYKGFFQ